jgi:hypothetical protein
MPQEPREEDMRQKEQITSRTKFEDFRPCSTKRRASWRCPVEELECFNTRRHSFPNNNKRIIDPRRLFNNIRQHIQ